jgi:hypothetical protein
MGLLEQVLDGAQLIRNQYTFTSPGDGSENTGSFFMGSVFILTNIESDRECRIRFYDNSSSRDDLGEASRSFDDVTISSSVALTADISMSEASDVSMDPALFGFTENTVDPKTSKITVSTFLLEDYNVPSNPSNNYNVSNRRTLPAISASIAPSSHAEVIVSDSNIPTTYLLISASLSGSETEARLRLYNTSSAISDTDEKNRPFEQEITGSFAGNLIVDMILSQSEQLYFSPKIIGTNLQNMNMINLESMKDNSNVLGGNNELYAILTNTDSVNTKVISASIHVFSLEE